MSIEDYIRFAVAFIFVLSLMVSIGWLVRKFNSKKQGFSGKDKRLAIIEQKIIDPRNKMVLIRRDNKEHLVIMSQNGNIIVETGIERESQAMPDSAPVTPMLAVRNKKDIRLESF